MCFTLRLHTSAAPPRVGLTQALGAYRMNETLLTNALAHEFQRCRDEFSTFSLLHSLSIVRTPDKQISISCYNAYIDFIAHLYEFYLGCIKSDGRFKKDISGRDVDLVINAEVEKLLKIKRDRIIRGEAPPYENDISCYEITVPIEFGAEFRAVRNIRSHAGKRRSEYNLADFYINKHRFAYLLFEYPHWTWSMEKFPNHDWHEIERFAHAISQGRT